MATTLRPRPAALALTPSAEQRIADLMAKAPDGSVGVKLSTPRRGCSGLAYSVDYVTEAKPFDERIDTAGGTRKWTTVGVHENVVEASWQALVDALSYGLAAAPVRS